MSGRRHLFIPSYPCNFTWTDGKVYDWRSTALEHHRNRTRSRSPVTFRTARTRYPVMRSWFSVLQTTSGRRGQLRRGNSLSTTYWIPSISQLVRVFTCCQLRGLQAIFPCPVIFAAKRISLSVSLLLRHNLRFHHSIVDVRAAIRLVSFRASSILCSNGYTHASLITHYVGYVATTRVRRIRELRPGSLQNNMQTPCKEDRAHRTKFVIIGCTLRQRLILGLPSSQ